MNQITFLTLILSLGVVSRLLPHPANFTPIGAISLFTGFYLKNNKYALLPLTIMGLSDLALSGYYGPVMFYVYGSFFLIFLTGRFFLREVLSLPRLLLSSIFSSLLFFIITNFAVWLHTSLYAKNAGGVISAYIAAIPFFRNTLLSDMIYTTVIFTAYAFGIRKQQKTASNAVKSI